MRLAQFHWAALTVLSTRTIDSFFYLLCFIIFVALILSLRVRGGQKNQPRPSISLSRSLAFLNLHIFVNDFFFIQLKLKLNQKEKPIMARKNMRSFSADSSSDRPFELVGFPLGRD